MRAARIATLPAALAATLVLLGLGSAGCVTQVRGQGEVDPLATLSPSPTPTPEPTATPSPTATLNPAAERRITCLLMIPSISKAIGDWNTFVDHKRGTRTGVSSSLVTAANTIDTVLGSSRIRPDDQIRAWASRLADEMRVMAAALRRGVSPGVLRFNELKRRLQAACPRG